MLLSSKKHSLRAFSTKVGKSAGSESGIKYKIVFSSPEDSKCKTLRFLFSVTNLQEMIDVEFDNACAVICLTRVQNDGDEQPKEANCVSMVLVLLKECFKSNAVLEGLYSPRTVINRLLKKIECWEKEWDVSKFELGEEETNLSFALESPVSYVYLLDRIFSHQKCKYIAGWNDKALVTTNELTIADIYLYFILSPWFEYYKPLVDELATVIPSVIVYLKR